jgi:CrcB protein
VNAVTFAWVAIGGALGSVTRFAADTLIMRAAGGSFPWGTLAVNVVGSFAIGMLLALVGPVRPPGPTALQAFVAVGILGGFTTFSAFSGQSLLLAQTQPLQAALYVGGTVALCLAAVWIGHLGALPLVR